MSEVDFDITSLAERIRALGTTRLPSIPVHRDPNCAAFYDDGRSRLFTLCRATNPPCILVHPDRWDEFCALFEGVRS